MTRDYIPPDYIIAKSNDLGFFAQLSESTEGVLSRMHLCRQGVFFNLTLVDIFDARRERSCQNMAGEWGFDHLIIMLDTLVQITPGRETSTVFRLRNRGSKGM